MCSVTNVKSPARRPSHHNTTQQHNNSNSSSSRIQYRQYPHNNPSRHCRDTNVSTKYISVPSPSTQRPYVVVASVRTYSRAANDDGIFATSARVAATSTGSGFSGVEQSRTMFLLAKRVAAVTSGRERFRGAPPVADWLLLLRPRRLASHGRVWTTHGVRCATPRCDEVKLK